jgi:hypothetical protein
MVKIRILGKSFNTTHYGFLLSGTVAEVHPGFADYAVNQMKAAERIEPEKTEAPKKKQSK